MALEQITLRMPKTDWSEIKRNLEKFCGRGQSDIEILQDVTVVDVQEFEEIRAAREDQLRQLLSYCKQTAVEWDESGLMGESYGNAYRDVAEKLAAILDGES